MVDFNTYNPALTGEFSCIKTERGLINQTISMYNQNFIYNSDGHRGNEFKNNADLLYSGCSLTHGSGLPQDAIWGEILAKNLNIYPNNLSYTGGSIIHIVNNIFNYIDKYGDPKIILCTFPGLDRIRWFDDDIVTISRATGFKKDVFADHQHLVWEKRISDQYIKLPTDAANIINGQSARYFSAFAIKMLEKYCNSKNIYLRWATWSPEEIWDLLEFKNKINFINFNEKIVYSNNKWIFTDEFYKEINCHEDYKDEVFYSGTDAANQGDGLPHMGKHIHLHIAEAFQKEMENDNTWN